MIEGRGASLLGRNWLEVIQIDWGVIKKLSTPIYSLLTNYPQVFQEGLGTLKEVQTRLTLKPGSTPKFFLPRSVPYALKGAIEQELEKLERQGIVESVRYSD